MEKNGKRPPFINAFPVTSKSLFDTQIEPSPRRKYMSATFSSEKKTIERKRVNTPVEKTNTHHHTRLKKDLYPNMGSSSPRHKKQSPRNSYSQQFFDLSTDCDTDILRKSVENFFIHD